MSGQGFFGKGKDSRDDSPSSSPSTSKPASKGWVGRMAFLYSKRKPSLPLQSHYLSLPVGGTTAATSSTAGTGGMYMLHSEDLSVTEFAKLAGITIVQDEDDPTTYDSQIIGNEIHEHCRCGSSTTELTPPSSGGLLDAVALCVNVFSPDYFWIFCNSVAGSCACWQQCAKFAQAQTSVVSTFFWSFLWSVIILVQARTCNNFFDVASSSTGSSTTSQELLLPHSPNARRRI
ncbi:hypothetical protein BGZ89_008789 [Linnemannia elongata]|nr:hypothetical protein BGZ89_008789 [Linnemannia elongata]